MDPDSLPPEWAVIVIERLNDQFSRTSGYQVEHVGVTRTRTAAVTDTVVAHVRGQSSGARERLVLDGWADALQSLDTGDDAALEAFVLLLHANLDELWSAAGHRP